MCQKLFESSQRKIHEQRDRRGSAPDVFRSQSRTIGRERRDTHRLFSNEATASTDVTWPNLDSCIKICIDPNTTHQTVAVLSWIQDPHARRCLLRWQNYTICLTDRGSKDKGPVSEIFFPSWGHPLWPYSKFTIWVGPLRTGAIFLCSSRVTDCARMELRISPRPTK